MVTLIRMLVSKVHDCLQFSDRQGHTPAAGVGRRAAAENVLDGPRCRGATRADTLAARQQTRTSYPFPWHMRLLFAG